MKLESEKKKILNDVITFTAVSHNLILSEFSNNDNEIKVICKEILFKECPYFIILYSIIYKLDS